jgi:REP element-mobilizing transposase RayT
VRGSVIVVWISQVTCICLLQNFRLQLCLRFDFKSWYLRLWQPQIQNEGQFSSTVQYVKHALAVSEQLLQE